jgi:hypothetical protein
VTLHDKLKPGWRLLGPTTKPTTLTSGERIAFAKEALDHAVETINSGFIPQPVEHLAFLPPIGCMRDAELIEHEGHYWLAARDQPLAPGTSTDVTLPIAPEAPTGDSSILDLSVKLSTEPRNFEHDDFAAIKREATSEIGETALHSELPPLIWSFAITVGGLGFVGAKAFVQEFCKQLGTTTAQEFVDWLKSSSSRAKEADREQLAQFYIDTPDGTSVLAFCPFSPDAQHSLTELAEAVTRIADVAMFAADVKTDGSAQSPRQVAFIWDDGAWHMAWWATDNGSFVTEWLKANAPDPSRFLGGLPPTLRLLGPYLPDLPGASTPDSLDVIADPPPSGTDQESGD